MEGKRFDAFSRLLGASGSRRKAFRTMAAGALGSGAAVAQVKRSAARKPLAALLQNADLGEQSVILYEELASIVSGHAGSCAEMAADIQAFLHENEELISQIQDHESSLSRDDLLAHNETYADRLDIATASIHFGRSRCQTREASSASATPCAGSSITSVARRRALPSAQDTCDCDANCPMSVGWCIYAGASCLTGADCECCWTSYCGSRSHCMTDCEANECCTGGEQCATPDHP